MVRYGYRAEEPGKYFKYDDNMQTCCCPPQYICSCVDGSVDYIRCSEMVAIGDDEPIFRVLKEMFDMVDERAGMRRRVNELEEEVGRLNEKVDGLSRALDESRDLAERKADEFVKLVSEHSDLERECEKYGVKFYGETKYGGKVDIPEYSSFEELMEVYPKMIGTAFSVGLNNYKVSLVKRVEELLKNKEYIGKFENLNGRELPFRFFMAVIEILNDGNDSNGYAVARDVERLRNAIPEVLSEAMVCSPYFMWFDNSKWKEQIRVKLSKTISVMFDFLLSCGDYRRIEEALNYIGMTNSRYKAEIEYSSGSTFNDDDKILVTDDDGKLMVTSDVIKKNGISGTIVHDVCCALYGDEDMVSGMVRQMKRFLDVK